MSSPVARRGSQRCFCSSEPQRRIDEHTSDVWTEMTVRIAEQRAAHLQVPGAREDDTALHHMISHELNQRARHRRVEHDRTVVAVPRRPLPPGSPHS